MTFALNPDQQKAATVLDRDVVVIAGAGSGKTRVLTERFINGVTPQRVAGWVPASVDEIVAITFTDKAAGELADRVRLTLRGEGRIDEARRVDGAWVSTIHGLCSRLLRRHAFEAGVDPLFGVADAVAAGRIRAEAFEHAAVGLLESDDDVAALFDAYSHGRIFETVVSISRELAVRGLIVGDITLEAGTPVLVLLQQAMELFSDGKVSCEGYEGTAKAPADFSSRCSHLLESALELEESGAGEDAILGSLVGLVCEYKPLRSVKGLESESEDSRLRLALLKGAVGAAVVAGFARGLRALSSGFAAEFATLKKAAGVLDFDDLQVEAVELLTCESALAERYRQRFRLVMIDEFQDTDALQLRLVSALSDGNLCTVGDEKQSIYRFRGADIEVYRSHRAQMRACGAVEVPLGVNYRSHPGLLAFANAVFASAEYFDGDLLRLTPPPEGRPQQTLDVVLGGAPRAEAIFVDSGELGSAAGRRAEALVVAHRLAELRDAGVDPGEMAILVRAYSSAHVYAEALASEDVPAIIVGGSRFFELEEIAVMRALTRAIANPADGSAVGELLASEFCPMTDDGLAQLRLGSAGRDKRPLWDLVRENGCALVGIDGEAARRLVALVDGARSDVGLRPLADVLLQAVEEAGYDVRLLSRGNIGRDGFANLLKFVRQAEAFEANEGTGPAAFAAYLDTKERLGDGEAPASVADDGSRAVRIMSVHASKGLEFPVVVVPDLGASRPSGSAMARMRVGGPRLRVAVSPPAVDDGPKIPKSAWAAEFAEVERAASAEEDERILYVAFTRARDLLIASGSMNLRPKTGSSATHDLRKLACLVGVSIPIGGTGEMTATLVDDGTGEAAECRVRVLDAEQVFADARAQTATRSRSHCELAPVTGERFELGSAVSTVPDRVSYTSLHRFEQCARRFLAQEILGLSVIDILERGEPTPMHFGSAMHAVLQLISMEGALPSTERMAAIGTQHELDTPQLERLREGAERFVRSATAEQAFARERVVREMPFALPIAGGRCLLAGNIDLYARSGDHALIVDYKSGSSGEADELAARYELQAKCYSLAALVDGCDSAEVVFVRPEVMAPNGDPQETRFGFSADDAEGLRAEIDRRYGRIAASVFDALPCRDETICRDCPAPQGLCPNAAP